MTISFAIVNNINETNWRFDEEKPVLNYTSSFLIGVYAMWNLYVSALLIFYAPSHKKKQSGQQISGLNTFILDLLKKIILILL